MSSKYGGRAWCGADLIAIEAKDHFSCLTEFRNKYRSFLRKSRYSDDGDSEVSKLEARACLSH